jgi:F-type H+-transporting ATPase subunit a
VSHLVPAGCPIYLISFIIFIELIRLSIRPITLRVRLIANITAGHLLLFLVSQFIIPSFLLILLEIIVRLIQAFVFSLLLSLYLSERN